MAAATKLSRKVSAEFTSTASPAVKSLRAAAAEAAAARRRSHGPRSSMFASSTIFHSSVSIFGRSSFALECDVTSGRPAFPSNENAAELNTFIEL
ncbi:hypothetical protein JOB18_048644 [Solea senegalensis]|uniref:Uncharacterized protein n=1 Tax=Solea senegalensis TaxID=28829 RepID=A0AAV6PLY0_SOLSE|nr:hypothetical protein JOB18_048644 [Solea senegalensis]